MVVIAHTAAFSNFGWAGNALSAAGRHGVLVFFVISGFSISAAFFNSRGYIEYLIRRFARIWPIYAFVVTVAFVLYALGLIPIPYWMGKFATGFDAYNYFMHLTFLSFLDYRIATSIIGVEWTLPIEFVWYLILPIVLARFYNWRSLVIVLVGCLVFGIIGRYGFRFLIGGGDVLNYGYYWSPIPYGFFFLLGVIAHKIRQERHALERRTAGSIIGASILVLLATAILDIKQANYVFGIASFAIIISYRPDLPLTRALLENRIALFLGTISYSIYLTHTLVTAMLELLIGLEPEAKGLVVFFVVAMSTIAVSALTYLMVERPTNRLGGLVAARVSRTQQR
jgi:peptidoglycan/LPS O-acetylase OafA/YrhL